MLFRQYRFESPQSRSEFVQQLGALVNQRFAIFFPKWGTLYGRVGDDRFDLKTRSSTHGNVIWVIGRIDAEATNASGTLRIVPEPIGSAGFVLIVAVAIGLQFLPEPGWLHVAFPAFALVTTVVGIWLGRAEWRTIVDRLRKELGVTLGGL
jgi:hypothetical protein